MTLAVFDFVYLYICFQNSHQTDTAIGFIEPIPIPYICIGTGYIGIADIIQTVVDTNIWFIYILLILIYIHVLLLLFTMMLIYKICYCIFMLAILMMLPICCANF